MTREDVVNERMLRFHLADSYLVNKAAEFNVPGKGLSSKIWKSMEKDVRKNLDEIFKVKTQGYIRIGIKPEKKGGYQFHFGFKDIRSMMEFQSVLDKNIAREMGVSLGE